MTELTMKERLKVYIAVNPDLAEVSVNSSDLLMLITFAEEGERVLQSEKVMHKKLQRVYWAAAVLALWNLFFVLSP